MKSRREMLEEFLVNRTRGRRMEDILAGRPFEDATVLRAAHAYEQATDWHLRRPSL